MTPYAAEVREDESGFENDLIPYASGADGRNIAFVDTARNR